MSVICYVYHDINNQKAVEYKKEKKNNNKNKKFNDFEKWLDVLRQLFFFAIITLNSNNNNGHRINR